MPLKYNIFKKLTLILLLYLFFSKNNQKVFLFNDPFVSIIIPVKNNITYLFDCLNSIFNSEYLISYEIIVVGDFSDGGTKILENTHFKYFKNIKIIDNKNNNDFYVNCNLAAKSSKGKYIVLLRDNTKVHKEWLTFLLKQIESNKNIGIVGSKLIYPDGLLKEAGGIMWKDGDFLIFGKGNDANLSEYNYVKEVDFISAVSIIIKKSVWEIIGGFDERFIPIKYTDIDLSFKVRKIGYKVIYQPKSIVEHSIIISNQSMISEDEKGTIKRLFFEKWENELKYQQEKGNTFKARDRSFNKSRIFVIDGFVPRFDMDAGSRCCFMYLNIFKEIGFQITFLANDLIKTEPYTTILQQEGIEVLYGNKYIISEMNDWFKKNLNDFKYVYLQRPDVTIRYIDNIKKYYSGKIIYFAHDLHHIRLYRYYKITHSKNKYIESLKMKKIESTIFSKVDVIYVVGNYEYKILKDKYKNKTIRNIPLYIYENQHKYLNKDFSERKDLIFVGGMHATNIDAVNWFTKEIFPKIILKFPDIILHIVSSSQTNNSTNLKSKNIKIEGKLSDDELHLLYQKCRLAIAPLRFGAGVKGKVIEAAYNQIPMVTTYIGAEGIDQSIGAFAIAKNSEDFAEIIKKLYVNYTRLKQMSNSGRLLIDKYYSKKRAKELILKDFK